MHLNLFFCLWKKSVCILKSTVNFRGGLSVNIFQWSLKQAHTKPSIELSHAEHYIIMNGAYGKTSLLPVYYRLRDFSKPCGVLDILWFKRLVLFLCFVDMQNTKVHCISYRGGCYLIRQHGLRHEWRREAGWLNVAICCFRNQVALKGKGLLRWCN